LLHFYHTKKILQQKKTGTVLLGIFNYHGLQALPFDLKAATRIPAFFHHWKNLFYRACFLTHACITIFKVSTSLLRGGFSWCSRNSGRAESAAMKYSGEWSAKPHCQ
jgi:hypothetical protein